MTIYDGRVAVVTGGGNGIGRGLSLALAARGAHVVVIDLEGAAAEAVASDIRATGGGAHSHEADVRLRDDVRRVAAWTQDVLGRVDLLFNNAGVVRYGKLADMTEEDWDWVHGVNVTGVTNCIVNFLPLMRSHDGPRHVINTASVAGVGPRSGLGVYSASKAAVVALSVVLREELAVEGIGVSTLCPSNVQSAIDTNSRRQKPEASPFADDGARPAELVGRPNPLTPEQAAELVLEGVERDDEFIFTDPSWWPLIRSRLAAVTGAMDAFDGGHSS